jgi:hypothetical protein
MRPYHPISYVYALIFGIIASFSLVVGLLVASGAHAQSPTISNPTATITNCVGSPVTSCQVTWHGGITLN